MSHAYRYPWATTSKHKWDSYYGARKGVVLSALLAKGLNFVLLAIKTPLSVTVRYRGERSTIKVPTMVSEFVTRRLARGLSRPTMMTTPSFVAGLSQVRPEGLIE